MHLPNLEFTESGPDQFPGKEEIAQYFVDYAEKISAPINCGVEVTRISEASWRHQFHVETSEGQLTANNIVVATGPFQLPVFPPLVPDNAGVRQIHSSAYRNPAQLPAGSVLVVGAGSSGTQIAEELLDSGRDVYLSVGPHDRPPRRYRGQDFVWWLGMLGKWDAPASTPGAKHITIAVSGAAGGRTIDFRRLSTAGMHLLGRATSWVDGVLHFAPDLKENIHKGDQNYLALLREADAYIAARGLDLPMDPSAWTIGPDPDCLAHPLLTLDLEQNEISTIVWATGYELDLSWLELNAFDAVGRPQHQRGVSLTIDGLYFLGLPFLTRRGSSFIWGVWHDAKYIADHIATRRNYMTHLHRNNLHRSQQQDRTDKGSNDGAYPPS
ncbi:MAG: NAD(P)/FAD-dependent oxidoreductase [Rhodobacteraceae bacterium]|nr:NAD(P)/FAD-dependent oxidoreductase [Paracoccaceae bacterium]